MNDGVCLKSTSHPIAPWWKRLWLRPFHRDIDPKAVECMDSMFGQPVVGGKLYFFDQEKKPAHAFADQDMTIKHDWPVISDASGEFPNIFMREGVYSFELKRDGAAIIEIDAIKVKVKRC